MYNNKEKPDRYSVKYLLECPIREINRINPSGYNRVLTGFWMSTPNSESFSIFEKAFMDKQEAVLYRKPLQNDWIENGTWCEPKTDIISDVEHLISKIPLYYPPMSGAFMYGEF